MRSAGYFKPTSPGRRFMTGHDLSGQRTQVQSLHLLLQVGTAGTREGE